MNPARFVVALLLISSVFRGGAQDPDVGAKPDLAPPPARGTDRAASDNYQSSSPAP